MAMIAVHLIFQSASHIVLDYMCCLDDSIGNMHWMRPSYILILFVTVLSVADSLFVLSGYFPDRVSINCVVLAIGCRSWY
jgi:hypothetical protein